MPEFSVAELAILAFALLAAVIVGWLLRGRRCAQEKVAVSAGWQHQIDIQQKEQDRIAQQNTSLMEQVSQYQAASKDSRQRARSLANELKQAVDGRDELQRKISDLRAELDKALAQRDRLREDAANRSARAEAASSALHDRDEKIARLKRELGRWQDRVPPLVERYRQRDLEAQQLEAELAKANERLKRPQNADLNAELELAQQRIADLEALTGSEETRIDRIDSSPLDGLDASNDQYEETAEFEGVGTDGSARDDLKRIKGIGPTIEKTLHALGIYRFRQIADFDDHDIDRVADKLRGFRSRIQRENWIGQARILLHEGSNDPA